jgi:hypothetical protein
MTTSKICDVEPFRYQSTPQPIGEQGASSNQINEQYLEDYLNRFRQAVCEDIQSIIDECCGGGGAESFLGLTDTPDSYAGAAGDSVLVNAGETGLSFGTPASTGPDEDGLHLDYSTSEQATNRTDLSGNVIYQKSLTIGGNLSTGITNLAHGITGLNKMVFLQGFCDRSNGAQVIVPFPSTTSTFVATVQVDATNAIITVGTSWTGAGNVLSNLRMTLFYTKS